MWGQSASSDETNTNSYHDISLTVTADTRAGLAGRKACMHRHIVALLHGITSLDSGAALMTQHSVCTTGLLGVQESLVQAHDPSRSSCVAVTYRQA